MKLFAIVWILVGAGLVAAAVVLFLTNVAGPATGTMVATFGCIGVPFLAFGVWGLYQELKPYHYERRQPKP
jgi:uncharacterized membrane-anchored protein YitT (DUF2179 family)